MVALARCLAFSAFALIGADGFRIRSRSENSSQEISSYNSNCHPLHGRTYKLFVTGYDGGSLNEWVSFAWDYEWLYARYDYGDAMPVHFVAYPGYCNTYQLRNDWEGLQKYVCMDGEWLRAGCDRNSGIPVEFIIQSNGQYKMYNRQPGFYNYVSYSLWGGDEYKAIRSIYDAGEAMRISLSNEVNLLAPHKVRICFNAVLSVAGGSAGSITESIKYVHGKSQTKTYENEIIVETSLSIGATFPFTNFMASAEASAALRNTARETSSVTTNSMEERSFEYNVDLSLPAYIYQTEVTTTYKNNGVTVQRSANPSHVLSTPLEIPCVEELM